MVEECILDYAQLTSVAKIPNAYAHALRNKIVVMLLLDLVDESCPELGNALIRADSNRWAGVEWAAVRCK